MKHINVSNIFLIESQYTDCYVLFKINNEKQISTNDNI